MCAIKISKKSLSAVENYKRYGREMNLSATATEVCSKHKHLDTVAWYQLSRYLRIE